MAFMSVSLLGTTGKGRHPQALDIQACITVLGLYGICFAYAVIWQLQKHYRYQKPVS